MFSRRIGEYSTIQNHNATFSSGTVSIRETTLPRPSDFPPYGLRICFQLVSKLQLIDILLFPTDAEPMFCGRYEERSKQNLISHAAHSSHQLPCNVLFSLRKPAICVCFRWRWRWRQRLEVKLSCHTSSPENLPGSQSPPHLSDSPSPPVTLRMLTPPLHRLHCSIVVCFYHCTKVSSH